MNDRKGKPASKSAVPAPAYGSPPERQILFPLTPPATDEWHSTSGSKSPISAGLGLIRQRQRCGLVGISKRLKLRRQEYNSLLERLEESPRLKDFTDNKLRYAYFDILLCRRTNLTISGWNMTPRRRYFVYACQRQSMKAFRGRCRMKSSASSRT